MELFEESIESKETTNYYLPDSSREESDDAASGRAPAGQANLPRLLFPCCSDSQQHGQVVGPMEWRWRALHHSFCVPRVAVQIGSVVKTLSDNVSVYKWEETMLYFFVDEADRLLCRAFESEMNSFLGLLKAYQAIPTWLFSPTFPK